MKILKLTPAIKDYIWGGTRLSKEFDMVSFTDRQAEAWVLSCHEAGHSIVENGAVYFAAVGGAGALYSGCIESCSVIGFDDLGCESVKELVVKDFPLLVAIDSQGNSLYYK